MPVIYMKHEVHGAKIANMEAEAVADEKNGWTRYTLDTHSSEEAAPKKEVKSRARKVAETEQPVDSAVPDFLAPQADQGE